MARHNYSFEKRQRDLAKKQKKEEKRQRKLERVDEPGAEGLAEDTNAEGAETGDETDPPAPGEPTP
ncbi:MAG: hypothetical protein EXR94_02530 [Gemmatimonadetes bacterium]|nr:hypothetical protein [Gemmatimonadota bacterium]